MRCSFPKCLRGHLAKGFCRAHYDQLRAGRQLRDIRRPVTYPSTCIFDECARPYRSLGYCDMHYQQLRKHGRVFRLVQDTPRHARFATAIRVDSSGCWFFGAGKRNDYAYFTFDGCSIAAHRYAYEQVVGAYRVHAMHLGKNHYGGTFRDLDAAAKAARDLRARIFTHSNGE